MPIEAKALAMPDHVPSFNEWKATCGVQLAPDSPYTMAQLYSSIYEDNEQRLFRAADFFKDGLPAHVEPDEIIRYGRAVELEIYYQIGNETYKLREIRHRVRRDNPGLLTLSPSPARPALHSVTERMHLDGEPQDVATIRAMHEELFDNPDIEKLFPKLEETLREHVQLREPFRVEKQPDEFGNSFKGLRTIYDIFPAQITFTPNMNVPIYLDDQGRPQPLVENGDPRYFNMFVWDRVER